MTLEKHRPTAERASRVVFGYEHEAFDDGVQEAMISLWKQEEKGEEISEALAYTIAKRRCLNLLKSRNQMTGHERAWASPPPSLVASLESIMDGWTDTDHAAVLMGPDLTEEVDTVSSVRQLLKRMDPKTREYVFRRFYLDQNLEELASDVGYTYNGTQKKWRLRYKPALVALLEEVHDVA